MDGEAGKGSETSRRRHAALTRRGFLTAASGLAALPLSSSGATEARSPDALRVVAGEAAGISAAPVAFSQASHPGYAQQMADRMPATMALLEEFGTLFDWMEANGFFMPSDAYPGDLLGLLGSADDLQKSRVTMIMFRVATPEQARRHVTARLGKAIPDIEKRLVPFARTGGDGSHVAFWRDDEGHRQIVHLGYEGRVCLVGHTPLDFLRLLAIGYEAVSEDCLPSPSTPPAEEGRNQLYRAWLSESYNVTIPQTAIEIVGNIPGPWSETSDDPFWLWVNKIQSERDR